MDGSRSRTPIAPYERHTLEALVPSFSIHYVVGFAGHNGLSNVLGGVPCSEFRDVDSVQ